MPDSLPLKIDCLCHNYGDTEIIKDISLTIGPGELVAILGASGSGKSTILRSVAGFVTPSSGSISLGGKQVVQNGVELIPAEQRRVGMVFQDYALFEHMSVRDNIGFGIHQDPNRDQRVDELLQLVSLEGYGDRSPSSLSGGQQQRVALVRALAPRPSLLVLDEPFANLDGPLLRDVSLELKRVLANQRVSALLVTHERGEALGLADRVAILDCPTEGRAARLVQTGTPEQVYDQPATAGAAVLSGFVCFVSGSATGTTVATPLGTLPISTPREGACRVVLRPEQIKLLTGHGQSRVSSRRFEGGSYEIEVDSPAGLLVTSMPSDTAPSIGSQVEVHIIGSCHTVDP